MLKGLSRAQPTGNHSFSMQWGLAVVAVLALGGYLRFTGLNWDENTHLHPDERFLIMVVSGLEWPSSLPEYLDESRSPLNPRNRGQGFFAYGTLPTTLLRGVSELLGTTSFDGIYFIGRFLSACFDLGTILLLFALARNLYRDNGTALLAAFLYSVAVLPIQHSHFFVSESFLVFFFLGTLYWTIRIQFRGRQIDYAMTGLFLGLAAACKITAVQLVPVIGIAVAFRLIRGRRQQEVRLRESLFCLLGLGLAALVFFRLAQPDAFSPGWLPWLSERWLSNIREVSKMASGEIDFPPGVQWVGRSAFWFPLKNILLWGLGIPLGLASLLGWCGAALGLLRSRNRQNLVPVMAIGVAFLLHSSAWASPSRYLLPIYPLLALLAGWGTVRFLLWLKALKSGFWSVEPIRKTTAVLVLLVLVGGSTAWAVAFTSIYKRQHPRVEASRWIFANVPPGSTLGVEHWDDSLPLRVDGKEPASVFQFQNMSWYELDTPEKRDRALQWLESADYIILSSNRLYESIPRLPARYPMTISYYQNLRGGNLGFELVAEFTSYPTLFGIAIPDQQVEESLTVYDHPKVEIYAKTDRYETARVAELFSRTDWDSVVPVTARQYHDAPNLLSFQPEIFERYREHFDWVRTFNPSGFAGRHPVLVWILFLELFFLIGSPWALWISQGHPDRGIGLARLLGWLIATWTVWLVCSLRILKFETATVGWIVLFLLAVSLLALFRCRRYLLARMESSLRTILLGDLLFWGAFFLMLAVRAGNPDLWHPTLGGEKPMDFSYLNGVIRSPYFPPMDPWFAGGYLNYYYFGFTLVAVMVQATGVLPEIAYNLALATFFGLGVSACFSGALSLLAGTGRRLARHSVVLAAAAAGMICLAGNLGIVHVVLEPLRKLSQITFSSTIPWLESSVKTVDGLYRVLFTGASFHINLEWWYWQPTRLISHPPAEAGPINEFPWFTYLFGDLHAHAMGFPLALAIAALATLLFRGYIRRPPQAAALLLLCSLLTGALWATNTWDLPISSGLLLAAIVLAPRRCLPWRPEARILLWAGVMASSYLLYLPFHLWSRAGYQSPTLWNGSRTPVADFILIHGLYLLILVTGLLSEYRSNDNPGVLVRLFQTTVRHWETLPRLMSLFAGLRLSPMAKLGVGAALAGIAAGLLLILFQLFLPGFLLILLVFVCVLFSRGQPGLLQWTLVLTGFSLSLALLVEFVALQGDVGRMNTVFKFYLQVWWLWGLASAGWLLRLWRTREPRRRTFAFLLPLGILFLVAFATTVTATLARLEHRFEPSLPPTLNGMEFMKTAVYRFGDVPIHLSGEMEAMEWLRNSAVGSPVILEANTHPRLYAWGNRYTMFTGLPSIVGWHWHQQQQRALLPGGLILNRVQHVREIYDTLDIDRALHLLRHYQVEYIVVGPLERSLYRKEGLEKFGALSSSGIVPAFSNGEVQIYRFSRGT